MPRTATAPLKPSAAAAGASPPWYSVLYAPPNGTVPPRGIPLRPTSIHAPPLPTVLGPVWPAGIPSHGTVPPRGILTTTRGPASAAVATGANGANGAAATAAAAAGIAGDGGGGDGDGDGGGGDGGGGEGGGGVGGGGNGGGAHGTAAAKAAGTGAGAATVRPTGIHALPLPTVLWRCLLLGGAMTHARTRASVSLVRKTAMAS